MAKRNHRDDRFLVMDLPSAYNGILGRTSLSAMGIITSVCHQLIKFPTPNGIDQVREINQLPGDAITPWKITPTNFHQPRQTTKISSTKETMRLFRLEVF